MRLFLLFVTLMMIPSTAWPAAWVGPWKLNAADAIASTGTTVTSVSNKGQNSSAFLYAPSTITDDENAPSLRLSGRFGHTLCLTTDTDAAGNGTGALTAEILWSGHSSESVVNYMVLVATLTSSSPCVYDVPQGIVVLRSAAAASTNGLVVVRANK